MLILQQRIMKEEGDKSHVCLCVCVSFLSVLLCVFRVMQRETFQSSISTASNYQPSRKSCVITHVSTAPNPQYKLSAWAITQSHPC